MQRQERASRARSPVGTVEAGLVADYPVGSLEPVGTMALAVGRDAKRLYALTLTCTHAGCNMAVDGNVSAGGIVCTCHGSRFERPGLPSVSLTRS